MVDADKLIGAIGNVVSIGSNSDGYYCKFGNGLAVQWGAKTVSLACSAAFGSLFRTGGGGFLIPYPIPFTAAAELLVGSMLDLNGTSVIRTTTSEDETQGSIIIAQGASSGATNRTVNWIAIGRWK